VQTASTDDHLGWAETLVDAGLFFQAQQQLDLLRELGASSARANWLRARLELVRLRNASERSRRRLDTNVLMPEWWKSPEKIKRWLEAATEQSPEFGPAWLTAAQVYLDPTCGQDFARALQCAQRAQALLGETPEVLLALGQTLRGLGCASEAVAVLRRITARYLFSWDNIPGNDSERLLRYLKDDHNISWVESAEIRKSDDGKAIRIFKDKNSAEIRIEAEKVTLEISDVRIHDLKVKQEKGELNIYEESTQAREALKFAELEARCQSEPVDVDAHLRLGRWCFRNNQRDRARKIFTRLLERCSDCAEGYYGLAQLAFTDYDKKETERYTEAHRLSHEALKRNQDFGLAYELLGTIFHNLRFGMGKVDFPVKDPIDYYRRALQHDTTCDVALCSVAEDYIEHGQLQPAIKLLEKAAKLDTDISSVYFILAVIYKGTRQFEKEDWARHKAKELSPDTDLSSEYENKILQLCGFEY
jgi:tetratricopeptide (TPR) repeat protein